MIFVLDFWRSTIGKKVIVAVSGSILLIYVFLHMAGNLNSLWGAGGGEEARVNWYAEWLRDFGEPLLPHSSVLWAVRAVLLLALVVHVTGVVQLTKRNRGARPPQYPAKRIKRSFSSITMMTTGLLLLAFIVFHILQFTSLTIDVTPLKEGDVYANLYYAFHKWYFVVIYLAAVVFLGFHLRHAIWSLCQTLGLDAPSRNRQIRIAATGLSILLVIGFASVPILFSTDVLGAPETTTALLTPLGGFA
ncbi:MAG: succinate dehydrogenase cytochrome b subunit [Thermoleophilia bacterium]|nr:succinate dehydrogenase cytochrome b subunit [Thermoleophilia bacterium]